MTDPVPWHVEASASLRATAKEIAVKQNREAIGTVERRIIIALMAAMFDAVRDEWNVTVAAAGLEHEVAVARKLAETEGYTEPELICGLPGSKPMVAIIDGKESVCFERSMFGLLPLVAIFTDKVREAIDVAALVGERVATAEAAKAQTDKADEST